jgi:iron complex outermembrane receptor protein
MRELTYNAPTLNDERAFHSSLELRYELDGGVVLRSVSGLPEQADRQPIRQRRGDDASTTDPAASFNQVTDQFVRERQWTQEFNVISPDRRRLQLDPRGLLSRRTRSTSSSKP